jgi:hypothetical protein
MSTRTQSHNESDEKIFLRPKKRYTREETAPVRWFVTGHEFTRAEKATKSRSGFSAC